ncbi:MAG: prepilin-type N-terminal cleavage/methylation domain-containing protein [Gemmatimonadota bacterium]
MSRSGYKLIELLVAMLIMAILTAMKSVWNAQWGRV